MTKFTILFITKNRNDILKSLNSCLNIKKYYQNIKIIILDGNKNDFISRRVKNFSKKIELKIVKQKKLVL